MTSARWWRVVAGWLVPAATGIACAVLSWAYLAPTVDVFDALGAGLALLAIALVWLVLAVWGAFRYRAWRASLIVPAVVAATAALVWWAVPFRLGFRLAQPDLAVAASACADPGTEIRIGLYEVWRIESRDGGCHFYTQGGLFERVGVAYLPDAAPPTDPPRVVGETGYRHITGDWYRFTEIW